MKNPSTVLIVGAGPCGLMMACELRRRGVDAVIVDAAEEPGAGSRAILLWPPTLELYRDIGILEEAVKRGVQIKALTYHTGSRPLRLPLAPHMAPLILPQEDTVELLQDELSRLGGEVERGVRVTGLTQEKDRVVVTARRADGTEITLETEWLIAADGFRSTVRDLVGAEFVGAPLPITFLLAEGTLEGDYDTEAVTYYLGRTGVVLVAPLPGGRVRISGALPDGTEIDEGTAQRMLDERGPGGLRVTGLTMNTTFTSHERIASALRFDRCFLIGDAAHVHSVVGGQGLNLGFADARNLAWKLAGVLNGRYVPAVLDSYNVERRAAAEQTVQATGRMARQAVLSPLANRVRNALLGLAHRSGALSKKFPPLLSGWLIRYPDVLIPAPQQTAKKAVRGLPLPGTRSPRYTLEPDEADRWQLITVGPDGGTAYTRGTGLADRLSDLLVHRHRGGESEGFVLLRPDGYVAAAGGLDDLGPAVTALENLTPRNSKEH
ncbi:FAD-dependent oxidoreductase [Thermostaphylospora chromogena]|uniref:2-polyprenyl-6-methoxyphenol hydroxylase n=1 Tax=Thermostaphylospora chromogena TaxID=35622 RepID=A0A1H1HD99_9ACTN|nr:FAD-dependent monooxygenase [Thermostaphylospora chromogena]SDR23088.1 2-polyprenyl-6-methoxyphenol hydroxylase [Thermostaphylospora chromogena]